MPEAGIVYINNRVHTGQLKQAGEELVDRNLAVVDILLERIREIPSYEEPLVHHALVKATMAPQTLPEDLRTRWVHSERAVQRLLSDARLLVSPSKVWNGMLKKMRYIPHVVDAEHAENFLTLAKTRTEFLQSEASQKELGTPNWAGQVYVQDMILRSGVCHSIFFHAPLTSRRN